MLNKLIIGLLLSVGTLLIGKLGKGLTWSGFFSGILVGTGVYYGFGYTGFIILIFFFVSATAFGKMREKSVELEFDTEKEGERDMWQVFANGGVPLIASILYTADYRLTGLLLFSGSIATATGDTWATETGIMWGGEPFLITSGKKVKKGESGGVTVTGLFFSFLASVFISAIVYFCIADFYNRERICAATVIGGFLGGVIDSLIGALIQRKAYCPECEKFTEKKIHKCGTETKRIGGIRWLNNDFTNFISSFLGGAISIFLVFI